jgi:hypothetical protein
MLAMLKPACAGTLALALSMGGCATTGTTTTPTTPITSFIDQVQALALAACAFEPTADSIAKIWLASSAVAASTEALANLTAQTACSAYASLITPKASLNRKAPKKLAGGALDFGSVTINGKTVEITGYVK